jgi:ABC-2 type transport system permease protein
MNGRAIRLTARREIRERLRSRAFLASTVLQLVVLVAIVVVIGLVSDEGPERFEVGTVGREGAAIGEEARAQGVGFDAEVELRSFASESAAARAVEDESIDAAIAGERLLTTASPPDQLVPLLQNAARDVHGTQTLRAQGVSEQAIEEALAPPPVAVSQLGDENGGGEGLAFIGALLLYFAIFMSGFAVAGGVVEEKSTRVVEVILSAIRPVQLLAGKVIGIGLLGAGQVLLIIVVGVASALAIGTVDLPESTGETAALVAVCFVLGFALYACAFGVAGAIVSRQEDLQSTSAPLQLVLLAGYLVGQSAAWSPESAVVTVAVFVPPLAPMVLPALGAQGELAAWELAVSIALMVGASVVLLWLAARIYNRAVLRMGAPLKLRQALTLAR